MKPTHYISNDILIVKIPEVYLFEHCWNYFTEELINLEVFNKYNYCIIDGTELIKIGNLGISNEILFLAKNFHSKNNRHLVLAGFGDDFISVLKMLSQGFFDFPPSFPSLEEALIKIKGE